MKTLQGLLVLGALMLKGSNGDPHEQRLLKDLLGSNYDTMVRPVMNHSEALDVAFGITLQQVVEVDAEHQILVSNIWFNMEWNDYRLAWNESEYGDVSSIRLPIDRIWYPDVMMYNSQQYEMKRPTLAVVSSDGNVLHIPPQISESTCAIDLTWFPFDMQNCKLKLGSWTRSGFEVNLKLQSEEADTSDFVRNPEWELVGVPAKLNKIYYECCPEPYLDITYEVILRRRPWFLVSNVVAACLFVSSLSALGFVLPSQGQGKLLLQLSLVFASTIVHSSYHEKLNLRNQTTFLGCFTSRVFVSVVTALVATVVVISLHHRTSKMSSVVRKVLLGWVAAAVGLGSPITKKVVASEEETAIVEKKPHAVDPSSHHIGFDTQSRTAEQDLPKDAEDWKLAARALDRLCLFLFGAANLTVFTIFCVMMPAYE